MSAVLRLVVCVAMLTMVWPLGAQYEPLVPDTTTFFEQTRDNFARSGRIQDEFAYKERRTELHTNPFGRLGTGGDLLYEVEPLTDGVTGFTRRLVERDGKPVTDAKVDRVERRNPANPSRQSRAIEDVVAVLDFSIDRREMLGARPAIVVRFTPKPDARPSTRQGRLARAFSGEIWVDEHAREVARVEATAIDSISYGLGVIARLGKGARVTVLREPVPGDIWMPTVLRFQGQGRALLFRKLNVDYEIEWFDYRRVPGTAG